MKRFNLIFAILFLLIDGFCIAQEKQGINIPDILGYKTLKCDFHIHTVFSDGRVWPTVRVREAKQEGIDVISITDHIENRRFLNSIFNVSGSAEKFRIIPDHNSSYEMAKEDAMNSDVILIRGAEVSRSMPPGHLNAIFLADNNKLDTTEWKDALNEAHNQGAFITWNHPGWKRQQPDTTRWWEEHSWLYENGLMQGIEVINSRDYYPEAHQWAMDKNLTILANSDIHDVVGLSYKLQEGDRRPMTLVFAKERSADGVKEALFNHRTLAYSNNKLYGNGKFLDAIFFNSIVIESVEITKEGFQVLINNPTDISFELSKADGNNPALEFFNNQLLQAGKQTIIKVYTDKPSSFKKIDLKLVVDNLVVAPGKGLPVILSLIPQ